MRGSVRRGGLPPRRRTARRGICSTSPHRRRGRRARRVAPSVALGCGGCYAMLCRARCLGRRRGREAPGLEAKRTDERGRGDASRCPMGRYGRGARGRVSCRARGFGSSAQRRWSAGMSGCSGAWFAECGGGGVMATCSDVRVAGDWRFARTARGTRQRSWPIRQTKGHRGMYRGDNAAEGCGSERARRHDDTG